METFKSLKVRNYRLFWTAAFVSNVGTWLQRVAQDWLVYTKLTHQNGTALGLVTALQFLPMLMFGLYGGVIADRFSKRKILFVTQALLGMLSLMLGVLVLGGVVQIWHVFSLAFLTGTVTVIDNPTRQAFVNELVGRENLANAIGLNSASFNGARVIGPALAGVLIATIGTGWVVVFNGLSMIPVIIALAMIDRSRLRTLPPAPRRKGQIFEGLQYVRARPGLYLPILLVFFVSTFGLNFQITTATMAREAFGKDASHYGLLNSAMAVGCLAGALLAARRSKVRQRLYVFAALGFGVFELLDGFSPSYTALLLFLIPTGLCSLTFLTAANATVQMGSAAQVRGRVMSVYMLMTQGGAPIGSLLIGWVGQQYGARWSLWIGGGVSLVAAAVVAIIIGKLGNLRLEANLHSRPWISWRPAVAGGDSTR